VTFRRLVERGRGVFLVAVAVITGVLGWYASRVGIEHDNASLNATDAHQRRVYEEFKATFGNDDDLLVSVTPPNKELKRHKRNGGCSRGRSACGGGGAHQWETRW